MQTRKNVRRRIRGLYVLFFTILVASLLFTLSGTAFLTSIHDAREQKVIGKEYGFRHYFSIPNRTQDFDHDIELGADPDKGISVSGRVIEMDVTVKAPASATIGSWRTSLANVLFSFSALSYLAIFVIILMIINSLRKTVKSEILFDRRNVALVRAIGVLLIFASVCSSFYGYLENRFLAGLVESPLFAVDTSIHFSFSEIIMGILVLFIAEVFAIGYDLTEEQKLII